MTLFTAEFGIWMGRFLKIFPNLNQNWLIFKKNFGKIGRFCSKFSPKLGRLVYEFRVIFSWKMVFVNCRGLLQISCQHVPTKTKLEYPPRVVNLIYFSSSCHVMAGDTIVEVWIFDCADLSIQTYIVSAPSPGLKLYEVRKQAIVCNLCENSASKGSDVVTADAQKWR